MALVRPLVHLADPFRIVADHHQIRPGLDGLYTGLFHTHVFGDGPIPRSSVMTMPLYCSFPRSRSVMMALEKKRDAPCQKPNTAHGSP